MNRDAIMQKLESILIEVVPGASFEDVDGDENFREALDIDSFDFLKLVEGVEKKLGVTIPESDYARLDTLDHTLDYLEVR